MTISLIWPPFALKWGAGSEALAWIPPKAGQQMPFHTDIIPSGRSQENDWSSFFIIQGTVPSDKDVCGEPFML
jgi:hypothetical protein